MTKKGKADLKVGNIMLRKREHILGDPGAVSRARRKGANKANIVFASYFTLLPQQIQEQNR